MCIQLSIHIHIAGLVHSYLGNECIVYFVLQLMDKLNTDTDVASIMADFTAVRIHSFTSKCNQCTCTGAILVCSCVFTNEGTAC